MVDQFNDDQARELAIFLNPAQLKIYQLTEEELEELIIFDAPQSLELADRSVAWLSIRLEAIVLTGDAVLRKFCLTKYLEVRGILWIFDPRLPRTEITIRLQKWGALTA